MNFLETLAAEWYEYEFKLKQGTNPNRTEKLGYFVKKNVRYSKRENGGYDYELDVLAYNPALSELIHVETSGDANSWSVRKKKYTESKFLTDEQYRELLGGTEIKSIRRIAIIGQTKSTKDPLEWGNIEVKLIPEFIKGIVTFLRDKDPMSESVSEAFPLLRAMQMAVCYSS